MNNDTKNYLENEIKPIMEDLTHHLAKERPDNPAEYILEHLKNLLNYSNTELSKDEKNELNDLRKKIKDFRLTEIKKNLFLDNTHDDIYKSNKKNILNSDMNIKNNITISNSKNLSSDSKSLFGNKIASRRPRLAVSAEVYGMLNKREEFVLKYIKKTQNQVERIKKKILISFLFRNLDSTELNILIGAMDEKIFSSNEYVIRQGESGEYLFLVETGNLRCEKIVSENSNPIFLKNYKSGDFFGELALLYNTPRAASIISDTGSILWSLDRETFNFIIRDSARKKREKYESFLKSVEILSSLDDYELCLICDALKIYHYKATDYIIKEVNFYKITTK